MKHSSLFWKIDSENCEYLENVFRKFYEGKFGFLGGLEETWGAKEKFSNLYNINFY
jgi:hypothetical protein